MGDAHIDIVYDHAKIVSRGAIGPGDDEIVKLLVFKNNSAFDGIVHDCCTASRGKEADRIGLILGQGRNDSLLRAAGAVVSRLSFFFQGGLALGFQLLGSAIAGIGLPCGEKFLDLLFVKRVSLGLVEWALVPVELQPFQGLQDRFDRFGRRSFAVGILDAEDKLAAMVAGEKIVEQSRARTSNVEVPGRTGSKSSADGCHHCKVTRRCSHSQQRSAPPEASLKIDAIESGYAVPLIRLNLHVWCIDLSIRPRRSAPRARGFAEQAQSIERKRFKEPTGPLLWVREAGPRATPIAFGARGKSPNEPSSRDIWSEGAGRPRSLQKAPETVYS